MFAFLLANSLGAQTPDSILKKEYADLEDSPETRKLEAKLNVRLNSLENILKFGEYSSVKDLPIYERRLYEIAAKHYAEGEGLFLTWGTMGNCGRYGQWFDDLTKNYHFKYLSVNCSCVVGWIPQLVESYNNYAIEYLDQTHGKSWSRKLEKEILAKKRSIEIDYSPLEVERLTKLDLSARSLITYPKQIEKLDKLEKLFFNINDLSAIDESICKLSKLKMLGLHHNKFSRFPVEVTCLQNLEYLGLDRNKVSKVAPEIGQLTNLQELDLSLNRIRELPVEFSQLTKLTWLDMRENKLRELPTAFENLSNLRTLVLWDNKFNTVPKSLYKMRGLEELFIKLGNDIPENEILELQKVLPNTNIK